MAKRGSDPRGSAHVRQKSARGAPPGIVIVGIMIVGIVIVELVGSSFVG
jgi:hypothetical protein